MTVNKGQQLDSKYPNTLSNEAIKENPREYKEKEMCLKVDTFLLMTKQKEVNSSPLGFAEHVQPQ